MQRERSEAGMEEEEEEEEMSEPVSPTGQYLNSSALSVSLLCVLEIETPIDDSPTMSLLRDVFLPINPRFSSIMVKEKDGVPRWKKVDVKLQDHVHIPKFPEGKPLEFYDECLNEYLSNIAMEPLSQSKPLWEIHLIKYPTTNAAGNAVFKLHHALGDGYSLMGALLSCLQRDDDPTLPLTFPNVGRNADSFDHESTKSLFRRVNDAFGGLFKTVCDFSWGLIRSSIVEDHQTPIRSGEDGVEFRPIDLTTMEFSLDRIKQIKACLEVTINDVITGVIFLGTRLYMESKNYESRNANSTALVLLNTRSIGGYKSVREMLKNEEAIRLWGNQFALIHVPLPKLSGSMKSVEFVYEVQKIIKGKRGSGAVYLTGYLLEAVTKSIGPEVTASFVHRTAKNTSMALSNMIGPIEKMSLANHPIKGLYFMPVNVPQSLIITMMSYMEKMRVAVGTEKGLIDPLKFKACIESAFHMIFLEAVKSQSQATS